MGKINTHLRETGRFLIDENIPSILAKLQFSKYAFIVMALCYFVLRLALASGNTLDILALAAFIVYPMFVFSLFGLVYTLIEYALVSYAPALKPARWGILIGLVGLYVFVLVVHMGLVRMIIETGRRLLAFL